LGLLGSELDEELGQYLLVALNLQVVVSSLHSVVQLNQSVTTALVQVVLQI